MTETKTEREVDKDSKTERGIRQTETEQDKGRHRVIDRDRQREIEYLWLISDISEDSDNFRICERETETD